MKLRRSLRNVAVLGLLVASASASSTARADDAAGSPARPTVWVHIASPMPVQLQRHDLDRRVWDVACDTPCDRDLPLEDEYRVVYGKKGASGETFRFASTPGGEVTLTFHAPSEVAKGAGDVLVGVGVTLAVVSLVGVIYFASIAARTPTEEACSDGQATDGRDGGIACGLGEGLAGAAAVFSGLVLLGAGGIVAGGLALRSGAGARTTQKLDASPRLPTWRDAQTPGVPKPMAASLLTLHF